MKKIVRFKRTKPAFLRQEYHRWFANRKKDNKWRKPKGHHGRVKRLAYQKGASPKTGYKTPNSIRQLHPSGLFPVTVHNPAMLAKIDNKAQGAVIANVGTRNRIAIVSEALKRNIRVLNLRKPEEYLKQNRLKGAKQTPATPAKKGAVKK